MGLFTAEAKRIVTLELALEKAQAENEAWYRKGIHHAAGIVEADGLETLKNLLKKYDGVYDLSFTLLGTAQDALARVKQKAEDEALLERILPLLEERFTKKHGA